ncbi:hypothetical protein [Microbulbifer pacificus]|nr:hypothetical protein [Microbulbifer pacificus]
MHTSSALASNLQAVRAAARMWDDRVSPEVQGRKSPCAGAHIASL